MQPEWKRSSDGMRLHREKWRGRKSATRIIKAVHEGPLKLDDIPSEERELIVRWVRHGAGERRIDTLMSPLPFEKAGIAEQAIDLLVDRGWADLVERYESGSWRRSALRFRDLATLKIALRIDEGAVEWKNACARSAWIPSTCTASLAAREHRVGKRPATDILAHWERLIDPALPARYIREASAIAFWGCSKALDDRLDLVNQLREAAGLQPLLATPMIVNVHVSGAVDRGVLFVENQATFETVRHGHIAAGKNLNLVFSSGFRASAARVRNRKTATIYSSESSMPKFLAPFREWLFSNDQEAPVFFWGDLDFAALSILKSLRASFRHIRAWQPGYESMVAHMLAGDGHLPEEDHYKGEQRDPGSTGDRYADEVLLPALRQCGRFLDQESAAAL